VGDANVPQDFDPDYSQAVVRGDATSISIAAASVIASVRALSWLSAN